MSLTTWVNKKQSSISKLFDRVSSSLKRLILRRFDKKEYVCEQKKLSNKKQKRRRCAEEFRMRECALDAKRERGHKD